MKLPIIICRMDQYDDFDMQCDPETCSQCNPVLRGKEDNQQSFLKIQRKVFFKTIEDINKRIKNSDSISEYVNELIASIPTSAPISYEILFKIALAYLIDNKNLINNDNLRKNKLHMYTCTKTLIVSSSEWKAKYKLLSHLFEKKRNNESIYSINDNNLDVFGRDFNSYNGLCDFAPQLKGRIDETDYLPHAINIVFEKMESEELHDGTIIEINTNEFD